MTFTKEQLIEQVTANLAAHRTATNHPLAKIDADLFRIALAALKTPILEPVYQYRIRNNYNGQVTEWQTIRRDQVDFVLKSQPHNAEFQITAPPAPVSVPDEIQKMKDGRGFRYVKDGVCYSVNYANGWNQCRAALLQGKAEPVSKRDELTDGFDFDRFNDLVWLEAVASNPHMHSLTTSTIAMVALELNRKLAAGNSPVIPDGCCIMPKKLTAENGAKGALSGEFSETKFINCPECFGDDECETCDGSGRIEISVPVSWTTIKEIWSKGVEHFAAAPQKEAE